MERTLSGGSSSGLEAVSPMDRQCGLVSKEGGSSDKRHPEAKPSGQMITGGGDDREVVKMQGCENNSTALRMRGRERDQDRVRERGCEDVATQSKL